MIRDIPDVVQPVKAAENTEEADEDEGEQPILGHVSMATDLVRNPEKCICLDQDTIASLLARYLRH